LAFEPLSWDHAAFTAEEVVGIQKTPERPARSGLVRAAFDATHHFPRSSASLKWGSIFLAAIAQTIVFDF
jgi:hypothetical protein